MLRTQIHRVSLVAIAGFVSVSIALSQEPPPKPVTANAQELTRGPIHEAFGEPIQFDPEAGPIAPKAPPAAVDEIPPDQRPEGDNIGWIPGYWAWDDEAKDFLWVSGFWRSLPPDRKWVPGYWTKTDAGYQWVSGFWESEKTSEIEYLPPPPESLENGPPADPPADRVWIPGCWVWRESRYAWRPGYWAMANPEWVWVPDHYEWTPNGYVFVTGFWDYPLLRRGLLFAPATFATVRTGFIYQPTVVLDLRYLVDSLFVRPRYGHYYFGDYYDEHYVRDGIYPWFSFHNSRHGYDPLLAHTRHVMARTDPKWEDHLRTAYYERRENKAVRPPHTFREYSEWAQKAAGERRDVLAIARSIKDVPMTRDFPTRLERVPEKQNEIIRNQVKQLQQFRDQRSKIELDGAHTIVAPKTTEPITPKTKEGSPKIIQRHEPAKVKLPDVPHLGPQVGTKQPQVRSMPEIPRVPEVHPKVTAPPAKGGRTLPPPEDIIRDHHPKGTPMPKTPPKKGKDGG